MAGTDDYSALEFNAPMTSPTADELVQELAAAQPRTVVDIGCGWAELLLRLLTACPNATGEGIDNDEDHLTRAARSAGQRSLLDRVTFGVRAEDASPADLVVCIGSEHVYGSLHDALGALSRLTNPDGRLLLGTLFWEGDPTPDLIADFGPLPTLDELFAQITAAGWRPLALRTATLQDWDRFEFGFMADWERPAISLEDLDERARAREKADDYRAGYLQRRGVLGFAYLTLGRPTA